jgi:serine/threonine protein kinase
MKFESIQSEYIEFLKNIKSHFNSTNSSIHKARNEIKIIDFSGESLVVKSFKIPNILNKIIYTFFRDSKAKKSYQNSVKIINFVPKPIGYIEFKKFGLINESYFVSENFKYDFTIREVLKNIDFNDREFIFETFAKFTFELHENNIFHLDYSPGNILIKKDNGCYIFKIVDINRMQFKTLDLNSRLKNFSMLWAKDDDLAIIIKEYSKLVKNDVNYCIATALKYSQAHKSKKNMKKRLRGKKVTD